MRDFYKDRLGRLTRCACSIVPNLSPEFDAGRAPLCESALALLVLGVLADNHDFALALDYLALFAHGLHGRSYFHLFYLLLASPGDAAAGDIIGGHLHRDLVAGKDPDKVHPEFAGNMRQNDVAIADIHLEHGVGQGFNYRALEFDYVVFCQCNIPPKSVWVTCVTGPLP